MLVESATVALNCFPDQIVNCWTDLANRLVGARRMNAVGEYRNRNLARRIDPDRSSGKAQMPYRSRGKTMPRARTPGRRSIPSSRPGRSGYGTVASPKFADDLLRHKIGTALVARDQLGRDFIDIANRREETRVPRDAAHRECVVVIDLADQKTFARGTILGRREHLEHRLELAGARK